MAEQINVCIGIQARSTSVRFPGKVLEKIGQKTLLERILDNAYSSANYINRGTRYSKVFTKVSVLIPANDEIAKYCRLNKVSYVEGDEFDVLGRYKKLADIFDADYVVRLTADCPFVPDAYISKAINTAINNKLDYCSNVDPRFRTVPDGFDVEVISRRAIDWLDQNADEKLHREHVTTLIRTDDKPEDFAVGVIIGPIDLSNIKISIDTEEDLQRGREHFANLEAKIAKAKEIYGEKSLHRF